MSDTINANMLVVEIPLRFVPQLVELRLHCDALVLNPLVATCFGIESVDNENSF